MSICSNPCSQQAQLEQAAQGQPNPAGSEHLQARIFHIPLPFWAKKLDVDLILQLEYVNLINKKETLVLLYLFQLREGNRTSIH